MPVELSFKPLKLKPPKAERVELKNGMVVYVLEDHELPLVEVSAIVRTGSRYEPLDKIGLTGVFGAAMRNGGTTSRAPEEIDEQLERIAATVGCSVGAEVGNASLSVLKKDLDTGLEIFADILMHPVFREDKVRIRKQQMIEEIRRRNDSPWSVLLREFSTVLYGKDHPLGWRAEVETIQNIARDDLIAFHQKYYHPNNIMLAVSGDVKKEEILKKLEEVFSGWEKAEVHFASVKTVEKRLKRSVNYVSKDLNQSYIGIGHLGVKRHHPDFFSVTVMQHILGGGFTSRMFREVRSRRGLTYAPSFHFTEPFDYGIFGAGCQTKSPRTHEAISVILGVIESIRKELVSDEELRLAKDSINNAFVFRYTSSSQIVSQQMELDYYGYPEDYLETYLDNINKVTKEDVLRVARKHLHPDKMAILAVGKAEDFEKPLSTFGEVRTIELKKPAD